MKYLFAKRIITCWHCGTSIERGSLYIRTSHRNRDSGRYYSSAYHYECYIEHMAERVRKDALYWMGQQEQPKKLGRPKIYHNGKEVHRLKALRRYHEGAEHQTEVKVIDEKIKLLTRN